MAGVADENPGRDPRGDWVVCDDNPDRDSLLLPSLAPSLKPHHMNPDVFRTT